MRKMVVLSRLVLVVICSLLAVGTAVGAPAPSEHWRRLAVLEFTGRALEADVLGAFSDAVRGGAIEGLFQRDVKVMTRENMMVLLREMGKSDCTEGDCEVDTARNIGADFVISGSVVHMEETYVVVLKLHETKQGAVLASETIQAKTQLAVLNQLRHFGREMAGQTGAVSVSGTDLPVKAAPPAATIAPTRSAEVDTSPPFRRGLLLMPQVGFEYPLLNSAKRLGTGYRFGALIGGHLNKDYSLGVEPVFGMGKAVGWYDDNSDQPGEGYNSFEGTLCLLRHVALAWGEFMVGPKLGARYVHNKGIYGDYDDTSFSPQIGAKAGVLWAPAASPVALGFVLDLSYMRLSGLGYDSGSNTLVTSLSAALLL